MEGNLLEELQQTLTNLGLKSREAKVLTALSKFDYLSTNSLAKETGMYRQDVHRALQDLEKKELVEKKIGKPAQYKTLSMSQIIDILIKRNAEYMSMIQKKAPELIKKANTETKPEISSKLDDYYFELVKGEKMLGKESTAWVKNVQTIDSAGPFNAYRAQLRERLGANDASYERHTKIRIVTSSPPIMIKEVKSILQRKKCNVETRFTKIDTPVTITILDGKQANVALAPVEGNIFDKEGIVTLNTNHPIFVQLLQSYFDLLWSTSKGSRKLNPDQILKPDS